MKKNSVSLVILCLVIAAEAMAGQYNPRLYYINKPISEKFPLSFKKLNDPLVLRKIISDGINYFNAHGKVIRTEGDRLNVDNIIMYSYMLWELEPKGKERYKLAKIGYYFSEIAYEKFGDPLHQYMMYVFEDLKDVSYREINAASKVLKIAMKYKKMIEGGDGCVLSGGPYRNLGRVYAKISYVLPMYGRRAEELYLKAIECPGDFSMNYLLLGDLYIARGDVKKGFAEFDKIRELKPATWLQYYFKKWDLWTANIIKKFVKEGKWNPLKFDLVYDRGTWRREFDNVN